LAKCEIQSRSVIRHEIGLAVSVVSVSTAAILIRMTDAEPLAVAALRLSFSTLILFPLVVWRGLPDLSLLSRRDAAAISLTGVCLAAHFALWITSLYLTTVATSVFLVSMSPIFVAVIGRVFLDVRTAPRTALGILLAVLGVMLVVGPGMEFTGSFGGELLALGGALAVAFYLIAGSRYRQKLSVLTYVFCVYSVSAAVLLVICLLLKVRITGLGWDSYLLLLLLGLVPGHFGHTLYNYLLKFLDPRVIAVSTLGEPVLSSILAMLVLHEVPRLSVILFGPVILVGVYLTATGTRATAGVAID